jgi:hypothetical protein
MDRIALMTQNRQSQPAGNLTGNVVDRYIVHTVSDSSGL